MASLPQPFSPLRLSRREVGVLLALLLACRALALWAVPIYDDAFITFRYAHNWASGAGLVYNPGEPWEPVLGTTTLGYTGLLAFFARLGGDPTWVAPVFNLLCDLASGWLLLELCDRRRIVGGVALAGFAALPQLSRISAGGMESPLFALLALGAALAFERRRWRWAGACAALDCLVRPEAVLLAALLVVCSWRVREPGATRRILVPIVLVGAVSMLALLATFGDIVPQSVHAKLALDAGADWRVSLGRAVMILQQSFCPHPSLLLVLPLVAWGAWLGLRRTPGLRILSLFALAIVASYLATRPHVWGWYFFVPLVGWCVWLGMGCEALAARLHARRGERALPGGTENVLPIAAGLCFAAFALAAIVRRAPVRERVYQPLQRWARATSRLQPHARILASDIGAIGWAWEGTVLDSEGLTWPQAFLFRLPNRMIRELEPEYLLIVAERPRLEHFYGDPEVRERYVPIARFSVDGASELEPALDQLSPLWKQDYLLYRRRDLVDPGLR